MVKNMILSTMCIVCFAVLTNAENWKKMNYDSNVVYITNSNNRIKEERIKKDYELIKGFYEKCYSMKYIAKMRRTGTDSMVTSINNEKDDIILYSHRSKIKKINALSFFIDKNKIIRTVLFLKKAREFNPEENRYYLKNKKLPSSYIKVTRDEAVDMAKQLHLFIFGEEEGNRFDSMEVTEGWGEYQITFRTKIKNNIIDKRRSEIVVNANNGQIIYIENDGFPDPDVDFNYKPKVSKEQALQIFNDALKRENTTVKIKIIGIDNFIKKGFVDTPRMIWKIIGESKDRMVSSPMMIIDSETGEVIIEHLK